MSSSSISLGLDFPTEGFPIGRGSVVKKAGPEYSLKAVQRPVDWRLTGQGTQLPGFPRRSAASADFGQADGHYDLAGILDDCG